MNGLTRFLRGRAASFGPAFEGWWHVFVTQPNAWIHSAISVSVLVAAIWLKIDKNDWLAILLAMGLVWLAEFFNTAIEAAVDLASPRRHSLAKIAKDVSAAAVVIAAIIASLIGVLVFWPPLSVRLGL